MRVLILIDKMPMAGSQRHVARLALGLRPRGVEIAVCCLDEIGAEGERLRASGIAVHHLGGGNLASGWRWRSWVRLTRFLEEQRPDILHTVLFDANLVGPLAAAAIGRRPAVVASRRDTGFALRCHHRLALRLANRHVDVFCANSAAVRDAMISGEGIAAERIRLIPNGIDAALWQNAPPLRRELGLAEDDFVVLCTARLRPEKGHDCLLRAVAHLLHEQPPVKLLLAGDGPEEERLRCLAAELGLAESVFFLGQRQDIAALLATADAFALLSASEGFANAALEAMAAGKAVVASDVGGNREAIADGVTGLLVPPADAAAAAQALRRLRDEPALRQRLGAAGRQRVRDHYSLARELDGYQAIYEEVQRQRLFCLRQARDTAAPRAPRLALVCSQFPRYDETFILREIAALAKYGAALEILSLRPCRDRIIHGAAAPLQRGTHYLPWLFSLEILTACAFWLRHKPLAILNAIFLCLEAFKHSPRAAAKSLAVLPKALAFARRLRENPPNFVHGFWATFPAIAAKATADMLDLPWGFSAHAHDIFQETALLPEKLAAADMIITCTDHNRECLAALAPAAVGKIRVIYHGLDTRHFSPNAAAQSADALRLLGVGSFLPCKGMDTLLQAAAFLRQDRPVQVTLVGDGPERPRLQALALRLGMAKEVVFAGYTAEEAMPEKYRQADVFVLPLVPRIHWGIPNVVLEAMACGLPVVVTALPSLKAVFAGEEIILLDAPHGPSAEQVAEVVRQLAADPVRRQQLADAGRKKVISLFDSQRCGAAIWEAFCAWH